MAEVARSRWRRRLQGVAFLVVVALLLGLTIAIYNKSLPMQSAQTVTLEADRIGDQLVIPADVKLRGMLVGRVSGAAVDGNMTKLTLKISKSQLGSIPSNVVARILPKTLFGEKFVELVPPAQPSSTSFKMLASQHKPIVIQRDNSQTAIEIQTVFSHLVPLLKTLQPQQLSLTLNALATALHDRGNELGQNLELTNQYFSQFNKDLPNAEHDISALADLASNYADATPDLIATLRNFTINAKTVSVKRDVYAQFLLGTAGFAQEATRFFGNNAAQLIRLAKVSLPVNDLYAEYGINLECLANGLAIYDRTRLESVFNEGPYLHITLTPVGDRGAYTASERPSRRDFVKIPPGCDGLPYGNHGLHPLAVRYPGPTSDHYKMGGLAGTQGNPASSSAKPAGQTSGVGSTAERGAITRMLGSLRGASYGDNSLNDFLLGPLVRGMTVSAGAQS